MDIILPIITLLISIFIYVMIYLWTTKLETQNCDCSKMWQRSFLRYVSIIFIFIAVSEIVFFASMRSIKPEEYLRIFSKLQPILLLIHLLALITVIILFDYTKKLKDMQDCSCSESWVREFGYYYSIITLSLYALFLLILFSTSIMLLKFFQK